MVVVSIYRSWDVNIATSKHIELVIHTALHSALIVGVVLFVELNLDAVSKAVF